jgi:hypothetical protein
LENYKVYPREERNIDGMSPNQLEEAMELYSAKLQDDIIADFEKDHGVSLKGKDDLKYLLRYFADKAFTAGMELAVDRSKLSEYYKEVTGFIPHTTQYSFEPGLGVSGVLTAEGNFYKCGNAEHHLVAANLSSEEVGQALYFSSLLKGNASSTGIISHSPVNFKGVTDAQKAWMSAHASYLDEDQLDQFLTLINKGVLTVELD